MIRVRRLQRWLSTHCGSWRAVWDTLLFTNLGEQWNVSRKDIQGGLLAILMCGLYSALTIASQITIQGADTALIEISLPVFLSDSNLSSQALETWHSKQVWWIPVVALVLDTVAVGLGFVLLLFYRWRSMQVWEGPSSQRKTFWQAGGVIAIAVLAVMDGLENLSALIALFSGVPSSAGVLWVMTMASRLKWWAVRAVGFFLLPVPLLWFWGLGRFYTLETDNQDDEKKDRERQRLRVGLYEVFWRSRYTILGLLIYGVAMLGFDQTRDVITFLADSVSLDQDSGNTVGGKAWVWGVILFLFSLISVMMLSHMAWLWPRVLCRIHAPRFEAVRDKKLRNPGTSEVKGEAVPYWPDDVQRMAEWWPRLLGLVPYMIVIHLCALAARDAVRVGASHLVTTLLVMILVLAVVGSLWVYWHQEKANTRRQRKEHRPYFPDSGQAGDLLEELSHPPYQFWGIPRASVFIPLVALLLAAWLRVLPMLEADSPFPTFPVLTWLFVVWFGAIGLLAAKGQQHALPYLPGLLLVSGVFSMNGWTDKHRLWVWTQSPAPVFSSWVNDGLLMMWALQFLLASVLAVAVVGIWGVYQHDWGTRVPRPWRLVAILLMVVGFFSGILAVANYSVPRSLVSHTAQAVAVSQTCLPDARPYRCDVRGAIIQWVQGLPEFAAALKATSTTPIADAQLMAPIPVYFVSSQGGGIRAAYWTALVLEQLSSKVQDFNQRTFSISGVSGGSIGASVYRVCQQQSTVSGETCVRRFGEHDFLTPLLAGWLFEDAIGRFVPTVWCATPGCGLLNRDAWFEQTLESATEGLHDRLRAPRTPADLHHQPHLFLNAVWVETGERVIASDLVIDAQWFPGAHDLVSMVGDAVSLSTASATSARFPFTNAIGSLHGAPATCHLNPLPTGPHDTTSVCGHLADGGYYDNSGGFTTTDVIRAVQRVIMEEEARECGREGTTTALCTAWRRMKLSLRPRVIEIRNGVNPLLKATDRCPKEMDPAQPQCGQPDSVFVDGLGPALTVMRTREANQWYGMTAQRWEARRFWPATEQHTPWIYSFDLQDNGVRFPLGWGLSRRARMAMIEASDKQELYDRLLTSLTVSDDEPLAAAQ